MAYYEDGRYLTQEQEAEYNTLHPPGTPTPLSGVYRCEGCGKSTTAIKDKPLPPQNHHAHGAYEGAIRWRLVVRSHWVGGH